jgi:hypothetical protein
MKIYLATWTEQNQGVSLSKVNYKTRLLSYFFLKGSKIKSIKDYVINGIFNK